ncbi:hypothetical protein B0H11DRAFT_1274187 [Mycena galericulata]|nr:hypothetical protein B0H11DRAFT_1274187 [Mycena galericulata]
MPILAVSLTYGSFGDILDTAKLAKRIIDTLRNVPGGGSLERERTITAFRNLCNDMATLATVVNTDLSTPEGIHLAERLSAEVASCRSLMLELSNKITPTRTVLRRLWMVVWEETDLAEWRTRIAERRDALQPLLAALHSLHLHGATVRLAQISSQMQQATSRLESVEGQMQNVGTEVQRLGSLGLIFSKFLIDQASAAVTQIRQVGNDVEQMMQKMSLHDVSDPVFCVMDPLGRAITIQLAHCDSFNDLDRILKAHLHGRPEAGSRYVERGDYSIVSADGAIVPPSRIAGKLRAGSKFDMSIQKKIRDRVKPSGSWCPHCDRVSAPSRDHSAETPPSSSNADAPNPGWIQFMRE